ncbi:MAG: hypothetical protein ACRD1R_01225 [Acidobacteriota bacterium]
MRCIALWAGGGGQPFTVGASADSLNSPGNDQRADQVKPEVEIFGGIDLYMDPTAFAPG